MKRNVYQLFASFCEDSQLIFATDSMLEATKLIKELIPILLTELEKEKPAWWAEQLESYCFRSNYKLVWKEPAGPYGHRYQSEEYIGRTKLCFSDIYNNLLEQVSITQLGKLFIEN